MFYSIYTHDMSLSCTTFENTFIWICWCEKLINRIDLSTLRDVSSDVSIWILFLFGSSPSVISALFQTKSNYFFLNFASTWTYHRNCWIEYFWCCSNFGFGVKTKLEPKTYRRTAKHTSHRGMIIPKYFISILPGTLARGLRQRIQCRLRKTKEALIELLYMPLKMESTHLWEPVQ